MPHQQLSLLQDQLNNGLPLFVDLLKHTEKNQAINKRPVIFLIIFFFLAQNPLTATDSLYFLPAT